VPIRYKWVFLAALAAALLVGCGKPVQSKEAVQQGLMEYLQSRAGLDVKNMDISITSVAFRENEADATVVFRAKGATDNANSMTMNYTLVRNNGKWSVKGKSGSSEHGGGAAHGMTGVPGMTGMTGSQALPPGHPPTPEAKK
jgi:hypothetical protein